MKRFCAALLCAVVLCPLVAHAQAAPDGAANGTATDSTAASSTDTNASGTGAGSAQPAKKRRRFQLGPELGAFRLSNARSRNRFGATTYSIGLGFTPLRPPKLKGGFGFDVHLYYLRENGNRALYAPLGVDYRRALAVFRSQSTYAATPYAGVSANVVPAAIKSIPDAVEENFKLGFGGSAFVGVMFGRKAYIEARYTAISRIRGFDLSGAGIAAGYRF